jgi:hypothetical protein
MDQRRSEVENPFLISENQGSIENKAVDDSDRHPEKDRGDLNENRSASPVEESILEQNPAFQMASQLFKFNYHPVLIFGGPASGKTSFITSMLASLKLSADWKLSAQLNEPIISADTDFGTVQKEESKRLFYQTVQKFIEGQAASQTSAKLAPMFLPLTIRSGTLNQALNIALMESAGEFYRPNPNSPEYFAKLRPDTESFIRDFEGGISFIYVLPYTMIDIRATGVDRSLDPARLREAEAAIVGILEAYQQIRVNKSRDFHLLLLTKWDAHFDQKKQEEELEMSEILVDTYDDVIPFLEETYPQALASLNSLQVMSNQRLSTNYCAGLITGRVISPNTKNIETRDAIREHQKKVWKWIWRNAVNDTFATVDPFAKRVDQSGFFGWIDKILDRIYK